MHPHNDFGIEPRLPVLRRLAVLAAAVLFGLLAVAALLAALAGPVPGALAAPAAGVPYPGAAPCDTSLQNCIDNVPTGTTIMVQPNTYFTDALTLNRAVSLTGVNSATVILNALPNERVLTVDGAAVDSSVVISGLTLAGGQAIVGAACPSRCGGAILIQNSAQPLLINLTLSNSVATGNGGALYADGTSSLLLSGVAVLSNTSTTGGGGAYSAGALTLSGGVFQNNRCTGIFCSGGGLFSLSSLTLTNVAFISNTGLLRGGGAYAGGNVTLDGGVFQNNQCTKQDPTCIGGGLNAVGSLTLNGTQFISNTSWAGGGGVYATGGVTLTGGVFQGNRCIGSVPSNCTGGGLQAPFNAAVANNLNVSGTQFVSNSSVGNGGGGYAGATATLSGGVFQNNQCLGTSCQGGGLYAGNGLAVTNTLFTGNQGQDGGGLYQASGPGRLVNDLFAANSANSRHGDALFLGSPLTVTLLHATIASPTIGAGSAVYVTTGTVGATNTLVASYTVGFENAGGAVSEDYTLFAGVSNQLSGTVISGGHSLTASAGLVDPAAGDYHLAAGSAAIDAGANAGIGFDADGQPRPLGGSFDIGYDEAYVVDVAVSKSDGQATVSPGAQLTYTVIISNEGGLEVSGAVLSDSLPASLTGAAWTCTATAGSICPASGTGDVNAPISLLAGGRTVMTVTATLNGNAIGTLTNIAHLVLPPDVLAANPANNTATDVDVVQAAYRLWLPLVRR